MLKQSMKRFVIAILVLAISLSNVLAVQAQPQGQPARVLLNLTQYVDPLIGTGPSNSPNPVPGGAGGSTIPGPLAPFGMIQFSPDTNVASPSGYGYTGTKIEEFSLTHFNGAGCGNKEDIPILPITGALSTSPGGSGWTGYSSNFSHTTETAVPGYYKVTLDTYNIVSELTATTRTGMAKFTYPATTNATVLINTGKNATGNRVGSINISGNTVTGNYTGGRFCGSPYTYIVYFAIQFDRTPTGFGTWTGSVITPGSTSAGGLNTGGYLTFDTTSNPVVQMKASISSVSSGNAQLNMSTENPNWDFNAVRTATDAAWNTVLNRIQVSGGSTTDLIKFYTALYHVFSNPNVFSDVNGQYRSFDVTGTNAGTVQVASGWTNYQNFSGWDIIRSWTHLMSMLAPEMPDIMHSMVQDAVEGGKSIPMWGDNNVDVTVMVGDPGTINVANAYAMGVRGFDATTALTVMDTAASNTGRTNRYDLGSWLNLHYIPGNAAITEEYAMADFALAQYANALGNTALYNKYFGKSDYWRNAWNPDDGYIEPNLDPGLSFMAARIVDFQVFNGASTNLALNKASTISGTCNATTQTGAAALDGLLTTKWCDNQTAGTKWLQVDLGSVQTFDKFVIYHAGGASPAEDASWNTRDFNIQVSTDAANWTTALTVTGNRAGITTNTITPTNARYIRLNITQPTYLFTCQPFTAGNTCGFTEGNSAQYTWMIPHNPKGLFTLMGGNANAIARLDNLFTELNAGTNRPYFYIGNEPEHGQPWLYNYAQAPWRAQDVVRRIVDESFTSAPGGLPGNDDLGSTSAWLIWAYLGLYPETPGTDILVFNGPYFPSATVFLANGNTLTINGAGAGPSNRYIQSLTVNGSPTTRNWIHYSEISGGATLNFTMGSSPSTWGSGAGDVPPSFELSGPTPTPGPTFTPTRTATAGPSPTFTQSLTPEPSFTPSPTPTPIPGDLAYNKPATASASCNADESPAKAVNGSWTGGGTDKWCDLSATHWWQVDLGASYNLTQFVIYHASGGGEGSGWNTRDFDIQVSTDNVNWTTAVTVTGNTAGITTHNIAATAGRYVKLNISMGAQTGNPNTARIYEVLVYAGGTGPTSTPTVTNTPLPPTNTPTRTATAGPSATFTNTPTVTPTSPAGANLALNKPATASASCNTSETAPKAVNGSWTGGNSDKWCDNTSASKWWQVDLGQTYSLGQFVIYHAGAGGESTSSNTKDFNLQVSTDGVNWTTVVTVAGNTANITTHDITATSARYVRINVTAGTQSTSTTARIYEVLVYAAGTGPTFTPTVTPTVTNTPLPPTNTPTVTPTSPAGANLALNKPATASASCNTNETAPKAVNGSWTGGNSDKWCDNTSASKWWQVDLGANFSLTQFVIYHAGAGGESTSSNTKDFNLQVSTDGVNWTTVVTVAGNTANITTHDITATSARYVRINVTAGTQSTSTTARIYEVLVMGQ